MITPTFSIEQDDNFIIITIRAPFAKISETEIEYAEDLFVFSSPPYFLRIHLPKHVLYDETGTAKYDADAGSFVVNVPKLNKGEHFPDLDMITQLLRPQETAPSAKKLVEEIGDDSDDCYEEDEDGTEYYAEQNPEDIPSEVRDADSNLYGYGFGWRRAEVIEKLRGEIGNILDGEPEIVEISHRIDSCCELDQKKFNADHYLSDTFEPTEELLAVLSSKFSAELSLNAEDRDRLKDLPSRKLPKLNKKEEYSTLLSLIDLVYAWAYDQRVNDWEESCESGWNIVKLAPSLSYLMRWNTAEEAIYGSLRRSLCYPIYRNFDLSCLILKDVIEIFSKGKPAVLHVLCNIMDIMVKSSGFRYLFNDLLLTDVCIWLQAQPEDTLLSLRDEIDKIKVFKEKTGLNLDVIEAEGKIARISMNDIDSDDEA